MSHVDGYGNWGKLAGLVAPGGPVAGGETHLATAQAACTPSHLQASPLLLLSSRATQADAPAGADEGVSVSRTACREGLLAVIPSRCARAAAHPSARYPPPSVLEQGTIGAGPVLFRRESAVKRSLEPPRAARRGRRRCEEAKKRRIDDAKTMEEPDGRPAPWLRTFPGSGVQMASLSV